MSDQEEVRQTASGKSCIPLIRDCLKFDEDGAHCRIEPNVDCKYMQKVFRPWNFVRHFRNEHTVTSIEKGFFRKCFSQSRPQKCRNPFTSAAASSPNQHRHAMEKVVNFVVRREGAICCNIDPRSECSYQHTSLRKNFFLYHFVSRHPKKAREHGLYIINSKRARPRDVRVRVEKPPTDAAPDIDATVRKHVQIDEEKYLCRISAEFCFYFQTQFNSHNFYRHFYTVHAQEAAENGICRENYLKLVNGTPQQQQRVVAPSGDPLTEEPAKRSIEQRMSVDTDTTSSGEQHSEGSDNEAEDDSLIQPKQEVEVDQQNISAKSLRHLVDEFVRRDGDIMCCAAPNCSYYQVRARINYTNFGRHIRKLHTEEAKRRGFFSPAICRKRKDVSNPNMIKEKGRRNTKLGNLVNENVRHEGTVVYCQIDEHSKCKFSQKRFNSTNFCRHFRLKHPNVAVEKGFFKNRSDVKFIKKERTFRDIVQECVRREGSFAYCQIDPNSDCPFVQVKLHTSNFKKHFLAKHPDEAERKGLGKLKSKEGKRRKVQPTRTLGVVDPQMVKLAEKVPDFILQRTTSSGRTRYLCNLEPTSECSYYEPLLQIGNRYRFVNHFIRKHPEVALENFVQPTCDTEKDVSAGSASITQESDLQQRASSSIKKPSSVRTLVDKFVTKEGVAARCNISPESGCAHFQHFYNPFNFARHFYCRHPTAFLEHGFSFSEYMINRPCNRTQEAGIVVGSPNERVVVKEEFDIDGLFETSGEGFVIKQELEEAMAINDPLPIEFDPLSGVDQCGEGASIEDEDDYAENESTDNNNYETTASESGSQADRRGNVLAFVRKEGNAYYCAIDVYSGCGYFQKRLQKTNFGRHFRNLHRDAAMRNGFFKPSEEEEWRKETECNQKSTVELVEKCVREEQDVIYCQINSESECTYSQESFNPSNFARHFRQVHPVEAKERGFFQLLARSSIHVPGKGGRRRTTQQTHRDMVIRNTEVNDEGVHCRIAGYCPYVQKKFSTSNYERHFRVRHPKEALEKGFNKVHGEALTQMKQRISTQKFEKLWKECVQKDELGAYCRLVPGCTFFQRVFTRDRFRLHFFQMHNEEAVRKGFIEDQGRDRVSSSSEELNRTIEQFVGRSEGGVFCRISESGCSFRCDKFDPNNFLRHFRSEHSEEAIKQGLQRSKRPRGPFGNQTFQSMVFKYTISDELGTHCRINGAGSCTYSQNTFHLMDYLRHFRTVHTEEAKAKQFFRTPKEKTPRHFVLTSQIMQHVVQTERGHLRCEINPSGPCEFTREKFSSRDFLRHFCKHHTDEAEENGFLVEIDRFLGDHNSGPEDSNDEAGPSGLASSFQGDEESSEEPFVPYESTSAEVCEVEDSKIIEQQMNTPHENPANYCRLCFSIVLPLQPIFASRSEDRSLAEQISTCAGLDLSAEAEPLASICCKCVEKLEDIHRFRLLCHTLDKVVRSKASKQVSATDEVVVQTNDTSQDLPVENPIEIQIKGEIHPSAMENDDDQTRPEVSIDLSDDLSQPENQFAPEVPVDPDADESETHTYSCCKCGEKLNSAQTTMQHYKEKHSTDALLVSPQKDFECHNADAPPTEKNYCTMPNCKQFFMSLILLRRHLETFHGLTDPAQLELMSVLKHC